MNIGLRLRPSLPRPRSKLKASPRNVARAATGLQRQRQPRIRSLRR